MGLLLMPNHCVAKSSRTLYPFSHLRTVGNGRRFSKSLWTWKTRGLYLTEGWNSIMFPVLGKLLMIALRNARVIQYPTFQHIIDYFKWRQADSERCLPDLLTPDLILLKIFVLSSPHKQPLQHMLLETCRKRNVEGRSA